MEMKLTRLIGHVRRRLTVIAGVHRVVSAQFKCCSFILLPIIVARRFVGPHTLVKINSPQVLECAE